MKETATMKATTTLFSLLTLLAFAAPASAENQWLTFVPGSRPPYIVSGGSENGQVLFPCRAIYNNRLHVGKTWYGLESCVVHYNGEQFVATHQLLLSYPLVTKHNYSWAPWTGDQTLIGKAVQGGLGENHDETYICRHYQNGNLTPGELLPGAYCVVTWGGQQFYYTDGYDVLIDR
jgi:hypothetical protein